jgi:hypothetical protein
MDSLFASGYPLISFSEMALLYETRTNANGSVVLSKCLRSQSELCCRASAHDTCLLKRRNFLAAFPASGVQVCAYPDVAIQTTRQSRGTQLGKRDLHRDGVDGEHSKSHLDSMSKSRSMKLNVE